MRSPRLPPSAGQPDQHHTQPADHHPAASGAPAAARRISGSSSPRRTSRSMSSVPNCSGSRSMAAPSTAGTVIATWPPPCCRNRLPGNAWPLPEHWACSWPEWTLSAGQTGVVFPGSQPARMHLLPRAASRQARPPAACPPDSRQVTLNVFQRQLPPAGRRPGPDRSPVRPWAVVMPGLSWSKPVTGATSSRPRRSVRSLPGMAAARADVTSADTGLVATACAGSSSSGRNLAYPRPPAAASMPSPRRERVASANEWDWAACI
jgi:hypothetical protein